MIECCFVTFDLLPKWSSSTRRLSQVEDPCNLKKSEKIYNKKVIQLRKSNTKNEKSLETPSWIIEYNFLWFYYCSIKIEPHVPTYICKPMKFLELKKVKDKLIQLWKLITKCQKTWKTPSWTIADNFFDFITIWWKLNHMFLPKYVDLCNLKKWKEMKF
jgi:hypothetical protein